MATWRDLFYLVLFSGLHHYRNFVCINFAYVLDMHNEILEVMTACEFNLLNSKVSFISSLSFH